MSKKKKRMSTQQIVMAVIGILIVLSMVFSLVATVF
jgi:predicted nucleic acid-binding Zn ribbon protein